MPRPTNASRILQKVIAALPPLDRGLMLLYLDDHSYREIAAILGLTETNVATKLNRLKQRVREEMLKLNRNKLMTYTELDDLKSTWQTLNRNLERQHAFALQQFREKKLSRFRGGFRPLVTGQIIQIIGGALLALWGGSFWVDHLGVAHLMIDGISAPPLRNHADRLRRARSFSG